MPTATEDRAGQAAMLSPHGGASVPLPSIAGGITSADNASVRRNVPAAVGTRGSSGSGPGKAGAVVPA